MRLKFPVTIAVIAAAATVIAACGSSDQTEPTTSTTPTTSSSTPSSTTSSSTTSTTSSTTHTTTTSTSTTKRTTKAAKPKDPLTGGKRSDNPVIAVKIDNTSFPQFGVAAADIVYTEQVEGGLTRLIAVFHSTLPKEVGAVRSMRSTDMELLPSYGPIVLVNSGGAPANVTRMRNSILLDVTEGAHGVYRTSVRSAPYNVHADLQTIGKDFAGKAQAKNMGFRFGAKDSRLGAARKVSTIDVTMLGMRTSFVYEKGKYVPSHNGVRYVDDNGTKVAVDNVIVQHVTDKPDGIIDPAGNPSYLTSTVGSGKFTLYRNGKAIDGTWSRDKTSDPTSFVDKKGKAVTLQPGKTWVLLAPQTSSFNAG